MSERIDLYGGGIYNGALINSLSEEAKKKIRNGEHVQIENHKEVSEQELREREVKRQEYSRNKRKKQMEKKLKTAFISGVIASCIVITAGAISVNGIKNKIEANSYNYEYTKEGNQAINTSSYILPLQPGDHEYHHAYHFDVIVDAVSKGDFDAELFGAYNGMIHDTDRATALKNMDTLVWQCSLRDLCECTSFTQYCEERGYVDENGKIDTKAYELAVKEYIRNLETLENSQEEVNSFRH